MSCGGGGETKAFELSFHLFCLSFTLRSRALKAETKGGWSVLNVIYHFYCCHFYSGLSFESFKWTLSPRIGTDWFLWWIKKHSTDISTFTRSSKDFSEDFEGHKSNWQGTALLLSLLWLRSLLRRFSVVSMKWFSLFQLNLFLRWGGKVLREISARKTSPKQKKNGEIPELVNGIVEYCSS